jgi:15-cis-phytoene synthase
MATQPSYGPLPQEVKRVAIDGVAGEAALAELVRRRDPDRFFTALFAPAARRDALLVLYAFNDELARASEVVSQPIMALIRLQWWREVVEGTRKRHEIATPLSEAIEAGALRRDDLLALIEAREEEADPAFADVGAWRAWLMAGAGGLAVAAGHAVGGNDAEALRPYGAAYGAAGVLRRARAQAHAGRVRLPEDALAAHGLVREAVTAEPETPKLAGVLADLAAEARLWLPSRAVQLERPVVAAALPAVLARRDLRQPDAPAVPRGVMDRLAVVRAAVSGRI